MYTLDQPDISEFPFLLEVWERSVRATHLFLASSDIDFFKKIIVGKNIFGQVELTTARDAQHKIKGFMGISENSLEMLFVDK